VNCEFIFWESLWNIFSVAGLKVHTKDRAIYLQYEQLVSYPFDDKKEKAGPFIIRMQNG
jgi:hypothetical protein